MIWIIDASVAVRWFIEEEAHHLADEVLEKVIDEPVKFAVPELFVFEVYSVLQYLHPNGLDAFRKGIILNSSRGYIPAAYDRKSRSQGK